MDHLTCGRIAGGVVGALALGLVSVTAALAQATINDCEKIQAADAYNQCLAKFGPTSKVKNLQPERPGDIKGSSEEAAAGAGARKGSRKPEINSSGAKPSEASPSEASPSQASPSEASPSKAKPTKARSSRKATRARGSRRGHAVRSRSRGRVRMTFSVGKRRHK